MPDIYRDNHIFVMTSAHEGMSNAMLEAMASGLPIISTRCEGLDELINNNGIIVEETNAKKVAQAMIEATNNQATFKQMAKASKLQADKFTWNAVADQYIQIYRDVLANKS
jgi:glycosyltransferase involved in cell wall biosynthesis